MATQLPITAREELTLFGGRAPVALLPPPPTFPPRITEVAKQLSLLGSGSGPPSSSSSSLSGRRSSAAATPASAALSPPPHDAHRRTNGLLFLSRGKNARERGRPFASLRSASPLFISLSLFPSSVALFSPFTYIPDLHVCILSSRGKRVSFCRHRFPSPAYFLGNDRRQTDEAEDDGRTDGRGRARGREGERGLAKAEGRAELLVLPEMPMRKENKSGWLAGSEFRSLTEEILFP